MAGRRPKPTALKELEGNPGKRALNKLEPKPTGIPTCPSHLNDDAKKEWKRITKELICIGLLTSVDRAALAAYCSAYARWIEAERGLAKSASLIVRSPNGLPLQNPYIAIINSATDQMRKFIVEFGMTPASRSRLQITSAMEAPASSWDEMFDEKKDSAPAPVN